MPIDRRSRAARLLDDVIARGDIPLDELVEQLRASHRIIDAFRRGDEPIPLERQLMLALIVRMRVPALQRNAAALHGQVVAAMAMRARDTVCHAEPKEQHRFWS